MIRNITTAARSCRRLLLITAMTAVLFFNHLLPAGAFLYSQTVTLSVRDMPLEKVCKEIEKQTGYYFVYAKDLGEKNHLVSLQVKNELVTDVLQKVFSKLPYTYSVIDKVVVINTVKRTSPVISPAPAAPLSDTLEVEGTVVNRQGEALSNASVMSSKTKKTTITDNKGNFKIKGLNPGEVLFISYAGYKTHMVSTDKKNLFVVLDITDNELDKVVIQAYGTTSRRLTTSNIGVVNSKDLEQQRTMNPLLALQGRVAGLEIAPQGGGYDLSPVKVEIRGRNVVNPNFTSDPLYIIDGVPLTIMDIGGTKRNSFSSNNYSAGVDQTSTLFTSGQSPLFNLNTSDIESIEVLKDADATAIYGSRGANGVILISTKKGKTGKNRFGIDYSQGVSFITRKWDMLNTHQYLDMRREAFRNDNITPTATPGPNYAPDLFLADTNRNVDWQDYLWGNLGQWTKIQTDYSGGSNQSSYRIAAGYNRSKDISTSSGATQKASFAINLNTHSLDNKFSLAVSANYSYTNSDMINIQFAATLPPIAPEPFDSSGKLNFAAYQRLGLTNPFGSLLEPYATKTNFLTSSLELKYNILPGLVARTSIGYNNSDNTITSYFPLAAQDTTNLANKSGKNNLAFNKANNWIMEPQVEYTKQTGIGRLNVLAGSSLQNNVTRSLLVNGTGYTSDALLYSLSNAPVVTNTDNFGKYKYAGVFARINYNINNRYILNLNGRRDGSSRFGPGKQFGNFGSVGAAWIISDENWFHKVVPYWLSFMKLRGSYGTTGSDAVGDYMYLSQWGNPGATPAQRMAPYNGVSPLTAQIQFNNDFHWQVNKKLEGGIDLSFVRDRITMQLVYYNNRCNNQLVSYPTPGFTGFSSVLLNSPAHVENSGWEYSLNANLINKKDFSWTTSFNISFNKNKLISYPLFELSPYYTTYRIGQSLNTQYVLNFLGVDPLTGMYTFEDHNHDGVITSNSAVPPGTGNDDHYIPINVSPDYFGGMGQQFRYKSWALSAYFNYKKTMGTNGLVSGTAGNESNTSTYEYNNRWRNPGDHALTPKLTSTQVFSNYSSSNGFYSDASFIRLSTVALSFNLPDKIIKKARLNNLAVTVNAQNLFVITKYIGGDPEGFVFGGMPPTRTVTAGIICSL